MHCSQVFSKEFESIQQEFDKEQKLKEEIRDVVKDIEQIARDILLVLQKIYSAEGLTQIPDICKTAKEMFSSVREKYSVLEGKIPKDQYYRYNDLWKFTTQRLVFIASYIVFLESHTLLEREAAAAELGVKVHAVDGFHLDIDDLLAGWILLAEELPRLSVCCATFSDHTRPYVVWRFVTEMENKFYLLSWKGESLRKRMEGLKFSSKKVADVVYDLSIRGLLKANNVKESTDVS